MLARYTYLFESSDKTCPSLGTLCIQCMELPNCLKGIVYGLSGKWKVTVRFHLAGFSATVSENTLTFVVSGKYKPAPKQDQVQTSSRNDGWFDLITYAYAYGRIDDL